MSVWDDVLKHIREQMPEEDFRRWFSSTAYVGDSGDRITVWVASEGIRRHITAHFESEMDQALRAIARSGTQLRFIVGGADDDEE
jgi:chromosomal replication initiation ATPase DnaA